MAIYRRSYSAYEGALTSGTSRWFVPVRYGAARLTSSKLMVSFLALCLFGPLFGLLYIYAYHNPAFTALLQFPGGLPPINGRFFFFYCILQGGLAWLLTAVVAPGLITSDFANGAQQLFFSRPFTRLGYVLARLSLLLGLLSGITWIPGLLLFAVEASLSGGAWLQTNLYLAGGLFAGLTIWILVTALVGLALSALVKWPIAAGALILGVFFAGAAFGTGVNAVMRTNHGTVLDLTQVIRVIWSDLLRYDAGIDLRLATAWTTLAVVSGVSIWILARRIRPFEIVR